MLLPLLLALLSEFFLTPALHPRHPGPIRETGAGGWKRDFLSVIWLMAALCNTPVFAQHGGEFEFQGKPRINEKYGTFGIQKIAVLSPSASEQRVYAEALASALSRKGYSTTIRKDRAEKDDGADAVLAFKAAIEEPRWESIAISADRGGTTRRLKVREKEFKPVSGSVDITAATGLSTELYHASGSVVRRADYEGWIAESGPGVQKDEALFAHIVEPLPLRKEPKVASPGGAAKGTGGEKTQAQTPAGANRVVNLLPLIDPAADAELGNWKLENGELISGPEPNARIQIPYRPPEEYDFCIEFTRRTGRAIHQILALSGASLAWTMSGGGGSYFGFAGTPIKRIPSVSIPASLENGHRYRSVVKVRKTGIESILGSTSLVKFETDSQGLQVHPGHRLRNQEFLGLGTSDAPTVFHKIEVVEVTGRGSLGRATDGKAR